MFDIVPVIAIVFSLGLPGFIVWIIVSRRHMERVELIKQGVNPDGNTLKISLPGDKALGWGLVLLGLGVAGVIYFSVMGVKFAEDELFFTIAAATIGAALLLYYRLTAEQRKRAREIQEKMLETGKYGTYRKLVENGDTQSR